MEPFEMMLLMLLLYSKGSRGGVETDDLKDLLYSLMVRFQMMLLMLLMVEKDKNASLGYSLACGLNSLHPDNTERAFLTRLAFIHLIPHKKRETMRKF